MVMLTQDSLNQRIMRAAFFAHMKTNLKMRLPPNGSGVIGFAPAEWSASAQVPFQIRVG